MGMALQAHRFRVHEGRKMNERASIGEGSWMTCSVPSKAVLLYCCRRYRYRQLYRWTSAKFSHTERECKKTVGLQTEEAQEGLGLSRQQVQGKNNLFFSRVRQKQILWVIMNFVLLMNIYEC